MVSIKSQLSHTSADTKAKAESGTKWDGVRKLINFCSATLRAGARILQLYSDLYTGTSDDIKYNVLQKGRFSENPTYGRH